MENQQRRVMTRQEARRQGLIVDNEGELRQRNQPAQQQYQNLRYGMEESADSNPPQQEPDQQSSLTRRLLHLPPNSLQSNPIFPPIFDRRFPQLSNQQPHLLDMSDLLNAAEARPNAAGDELMTLGPDARDLMDVDVGAANLGEQMQDFEWTEECSGRDVHSGCKKLLAAELDSLLDGSKGLGQEVVLSPIKALLGIFLLKDGVAKTIAAGQSLTKTILGADGEFELCVYSGKRADYVSAGLYPNEEDMKKAVGSWLDHCQVARKKIEETGLGPICTFPPCGVTALPEAERDGWKALFENGPWVLECVRAQSILRAERILGHPRILIGDSSAGQLFKAMAQTELVGQDGPIAGVIRAFSNCYLSTKVQGVLLMLGRDSLIKGETPDSILEQFGRLLALLERFGHLKIHWTMPPYVHSKKEQFIEVQRRLQRLLAPSHVRFVMTGMDGRSLAEIFRFSESFDPDVVGPTGWLTDKGVRKTLGWLYTQLPSFPGDRSLGIRSLRSEVVVPHRMGGLGDQHRLTAGGSSSARGSGLGDRPSIQHRVQQLGPGYRRQRSRSRSPIRDRHEGGRRQGPRGRAGHYRR